MCHQKTAFKFPYPFKNIKSQKRANLINGASPYLSLMLWTPYFLIKLIVSLLVFSIALLTDSPLISDKTKAIYGFIKTLIFRSLSGVDDLLGSTTIINLAS